MSDDNSVLDNAIVRSVAVPDPTACGAITTLAAAGVKGMRGTEEIHLPLLRWIPEEVVREFPWVAAVDVEINNEAIGFRQRSRRRGGDHPLLEVALNQLNVAGNESKPRWDVDIDGHCH